MFSLSVHQAVGTTFAFGDRGVVGLCRSEALLHRHVGGLVIHMMQFMHVDASWWSFQPFNELAFRKS